MKMKRLGRTGLMVTENSFGALPIQRIDQQSAVELLHMAYDAGINYYDTARAYSDSEEKLGAAFHDRREKIIISTKSQGKTKEQVLADLDTSLKMLRTDYVDILQLHNIPKMTDPEDPNGIHAALLEAKKQGKCRFIGITSHRRDVAEQAAKSGLYDTIQFPVSHISPQADLDLIRLCGQLDVGFIAMKGLSGGLLTNAAAAFAFFSQLENAVPIWGIQKKEELQQFLDCAANGVTMTPELQAVIEQDRKELAGNFCRGCGYCMPCRVGIQINTIARLPQLLRRSPWQQYMTDEFKAEMEKVNDCRRCGACESKCPYGLKCTQLLRESYEDWKQFRKEKGYQD
ncbi:aldo/keto reductase [Acidaminobacterium chupaoyuni]